MMCESPAAALNGTTVRGFPVHFKVLHCSTFTGDRLWKMGSLL